MAQKKLYDEKSIESITDRELCRLRPGVYAGNTEYSTQLLSEIVDNAIDEHRLGNGNLIEVIITNDYCSVRDYGQGFLVNKMRDDGETIFQASFDVFNTSGKYRNDGVYEGVSKGLNGLGAKLTNSLSHWLEATTYRDGKCEFLRFEEGLFVKREVKNQGSVATGTLVQWQPSEEFFTHVDVDIDKVRKDFKVKACLCPGLTITLDYNGKKETFYSANGISDLVDDAVKDKELLDKRFRMNYSEGKNQIDLILSYTSNYSSTMIAYVNIGETDRGPHITTIKAILTREFNKFFREKKWLKEKEDNLTGDDIQEGMYIVFNITAPNIAYDAQVKSTVTKIDMSPFTIAISEALNNWFILNEKDVKVIADKALAARRAREAAKKARDAARGQEKKKEKVLKFASKLADCSSKDRSKCEIYITEGDSATGGLKMGRNEEFQAVMPVRGKILNCQKASLEQIQKNAEIMTMIEAFGLTIDHKTMKVTYRPEDLRYGKIIIESDADVDGSHIKNLFYTFIWNFCPQLFTDGYIYAGVPPLYKVTERNGKNYRYLKNDTELEIYRNAHRNDKYDVGRMKGLGEMSEDEVRETLMDPDKRIIKQISINNAKEASRLFEEMMGDSVTFRKVFLKDHGNETSYNQE